MAGLKNNWTSGDSFAATDMNDIATAVSALNQAGPYGSLPAPTFPGRLYFCTDIDMVLKDNGTSWDIKFPANFTQPPSTSWTTTTLGSSTVAADKGGRLFTVPSAAGNNLRAEYRALSPTSNYTFTAFVELAGLSASANVSAMLILRNSSSGSMITFGPWYDTGFTLAFVKWSNVTTLSAAYQANQPLSQLPYGIPCWLRFRDDGTTRYFEYSNNGTEWVTAFSIGRTDFITPDQIGWGVNNASGKPSQARLRSFSVV